MTRKDLIKDAYSTFKKEMSFICQERELLDKRVDIACERFLERYKEIDSSFPKKCPCCIDESGDRDEDKVVSEKNMYHKDESPYGH